MVVDMFLLNNKTTLIPTAVNLHRLITTYQHPLSASIEFEEITEPVLSIPEECFGFSNHSELLRLANIITQLPDLIGEQSAVSSIVSDPTQEKHCVMTEELQLLPLMMMLQQAITP